MAFWNVSGQPVSFINITILMQEMNFLCGDYCWWKIVLCKKEKQGKGFKKVCDCTSLVLNFILEQALKSGQWDDQERFMQIDRLMNGAPPFMVGRRHKGSRTIWAK